MTVKTTPADLNADMSLMVPFREKLQALKKDAKKYDPSEVEALATSDEDIGRFLIARNNNLKKAFSMAEAALKWRSQFKPNEITTKDFETAHSQECYRLAGTTKDGCGIIHATAANWKPFSYSTDEYTKMVSYHIELALAKNPKGSQTFIIFDMANMSYFASDMRKIRALARVLSDYYPERLGHAVFVNCDWVFDKIFNIAINWVDERTKSKCIDFRDNGAEYLLKYVDSDQLSKNLGGTRDEEWPMEPLE